MAISVFWKFWILAQNFSKNRLFWENIYKIQNFEFIEKTGIYVKEVIYVHLHTNFEKNRFKNVGVIQNFYDVTTHKIFEKWVFWKF